MIEPFFTQVHSNVSICGFSKRSVAVKGIFLAFGQNKLFEMSPLTLGKRFGISTIY